MACTRAYKPPIIDLIDVSRAREILEQSNRYLVIHGNLIYNLAGSVKYKEDPAFERKLSSTINGLVGELDLGVGLGAGVIVHIGSCTRRSDGLALISKTINHVLTLSASTTKKLARHFNVSVDQIQKKRKLILENAAGEGNKLGSTLEEIATILEGIDVKLRPQVKVCIDTAHIFGAGQYDLGLPAEVTRFFTTFEILIGLHYLEVVHLNDSRVPFKSKKDRHENLGLGYQFGILREDGKDGSRGLTKFLETCMKRKIVLIGEPPAKTAEGNLGPGGLWDYEVIKRLVPAESQM